MSFPPPLFADVNKKANDFLSKDFPTTNKIEFKKPPVDGLGVEGSISEKDGTTVGLFTPKWKFPQLSALILGATIDTRRNIKLEASASEIIPGLKATLAGHSENQNLTVDLEYKHPYAAIAASLNALAPKGSTANFSVVVGSAGYALGAQTEYNFSNSTLTALNLAASASLHTQPTSPIITAFIRQKKNTLGGSLFHQLRFGWVGILDVESNYNTSETKVTAGTAYNVDKDTIVRAKADTQGVVAASVTTKVNSVKFTIGTSINTNNFSSSHGFQLQIE